MSIVLAPKQKRAILNSNSWVNVYDGSVRSGKTVASLIRWIKFILENPEGDLLMVGRTERTLKRNIIDTMVDWLGPDRCKLVSGSGELKVLGRRIYLAGANDEQSETRIRGLGLKGAYGDEVSTWPENFWVMLLSRLSDPDAMGFFTTNPDHPSHWLKADYLDRAEELDLYRMRFKLRDNKSLTERYIRNLESSYTGLWRKRFIEGEWVASEGSVYGDVWKPNRMVTKDLPILTRLWSGIDYGTSNPFVEIVAGLGVDNRIHLAREWRWDSKISQRALTPTQYVKRLNRWREREGIMPSWVFVDPEEAGFRLEAQQAGWKGVRAADNRVVEGIRLMSDLMAQDKLRIHESCEGLIDEIPGYVWDEEAEVDRPVKMNDHSLDAARYAIFSSEFMWRRKVLPHTLAA